jgi:hypothetical protein
MKADKTRRSAKSANLAGAVVCGSRKRLCTGIAVFLCLLPGSSRLAANRVTKWNEIAGEASFASGLAANPLYESRLYAIVHAAIHDALNAIDRRFEPYAHDAGVTRTASPEAAVATAAHQVLVNQFNLLKAYGYTSQKAMLDAAYAATLARIPDGPAKTQGIAVGTSAASTILDLRENDGWDKQVLLDHNYPQGTAPGEFRFVPGTDFAFLPTWFKVLPFALLSADQFRSRPPHPVSSSAYAEDFNELKRLGGNGTSTPSARTPRQTEIALFWLESSPLGWNRIARILAVKRGLSLWRTARLLGLINLALADGYIANWETKAHYNRWRPITAVREAATDGNPKTTADPTWMSLADTPAGPEYDSGHSLAGGAVSRIMQHFFGTDEMSFTTCSTTMPAGSTCNDPRPVKRSFTRFSQAAEENAWSRILVGYHFRNAITEGLKHGRKIGHHTFMNYLQPVSA